MKKVLLLSILSLLSVFYVGHLFAQSVTITDDPLHSAHSSAMLDVHSDSKGFLVPRLTTAERTAIISPATALLVFDTDENQFFYFDGSGWVDLSSISGTSNDTIWLENTVDNYVFLKDSTNKVGIGTSVPEGKLEVRGVDTEDNQPLFVVKDDDGNEVFVVYSRGVMVYVDTADVTTKSTTNEQLTGFRVGRRTTGGSKGFDNEYFSISPATEAEIIDPSEARVLWYPQKEAFMAGRVLVEHVDSVGTNSWASGFESKSIGDYSQALGYQSRAKGHYSTAIGYKAQAEGDYSVAIGDSSVAGGGGGAHNSYAFGRRSEALGGGSYAFGNFAKAEGINAFAFGEGAHAENEESYALGRGARAEGFRSFAFGSAGIDSIGDPTGVARAVGDYSFAIGQGSVAEGLGSVAIGLDNSAKGNYSLATGYQTTASANNSTAMGIGSTASGSASTAIGWGTTALGHQSTAMGTSVSASGNLSTAMGLGTNSWGSTSTAMGVGTVPTSAWEMAVGSYNTTSYAVNWYAWDPNDQLFVVGNGTSSSNRSDALIIYKNGKTTAFNEITSHIGTGFGQARYIFNNTSVLHRNDGTNYYILISTADNGMGTWNLSRPFRINLSSGDMYFSEDKIRFSHASGNAYKPGGGSWGAISDKRLKKDIRRFSDGLDVLMQLNPVRFQYNELSGYENTDSEYIGFIAQEVETIAPYMVDVKKDSGIRNKIPDKRIFDESALTKILVNAVKEQQSIIEQQNSRIAELEEQNKLLQKYEERFALIENELNRLTNQKDNIRVSAE